MFDALTDKFSSVFRGLSGRGRISEENIRESMREVRTALLEADVNFKVVKDFTDRVLQKALGQEVIRSLQPGQLMVKIVYDELVELLGPVDTQIYLVQPPPTIIMMCGLQGSGKTTTCGKLALFLQSRGHHPMLAAVDLQRPAAVEQLRVLGEQVNVPVYTDPSKVAEHGKVAKGAVLSAKMVTGKPVKFLGVGEKLDRLEEFRPEGMAQRILGMGDIVGLVTEAMEKFDQEQTQKLAEKMEQGKFTLDDFMAQMSQVKKLGPMGKIMGMIPGMNEISKQAGMSETAGEGQ